MVKKRGGQTTYDPDAAEAIFLLMSEGESLLSICRRPGMPAWRTVYDWSESHTDFAAGLARARVRQFDALAGQCLEIADDTSSDFKEVAGPDGEMRVAFDKEHVQRSKLRIETRLKLLAKWDPTRYGEKLDVTSAGQKLENAQPLFNITLTTE